jgi:hypothetical protein
MCVLLWQHHASSCMLFCSLRTFAGPQGKVTIVGIVTEQGIATYDGRVYAVVENSMGKEVMSLLNRRVEVIGKIMERGDGGKVVEVSNYGISE